VPQLAGVGDLDPGQRAWLTLSVQLGFVAGATISAFLNLADRFGLTRRLVLSAVTATTADLLIPLAEAGYGMTLVLRFVTGSGVAGVYPPA
jgi:MFS family permease